MTCIVGLVDGGDVIIGGDSAAATGLDIAIRSDPKVFRNGEFIMGFTSSFRMGQLLMCAFQPPLHAPGVDVYTFMVTSFVDAVRNCLKAGGFATKHNEGEAAGAFLVGYRGRLFAIHSDYQVASKDDGFDALGCGEDFALGALHSNASFTAIDRVNDALHAAERFSAGVSAPFRVEVLKG